MSIDGKSVVSMVVADNLIEVKSIRIVAVTIARSNGPMVKAIVEIQISPTAM